MQVSATSTRSSNFDAVMGWVNGAGAAAAALLVAVAFADGLGRVAFGHVIPGLSTVSGVWVTAYAFLLFAGTLAEGRVGRAARLDSWLADGAPFAGASARTFADGIGAAVYGYIGLLAAVSAWRLWHGARLGDGDSYVGLFAFLFLFASAGAALTTYRFLVLVWHDLASLKASFHGSTTGRLLVEFGAVVIGLGIIVWLGAMLVTTDSARVEQTSLLLGAAILLLLAVGVHAAVALMLFFPFVAGLVPEPGIARIYLLGSEAAIVPIIVVMGLLVVAAGIDRDLRELAQVYFGRFRAGQGLASLWSFAGTTSLTALTAPNDVRRATTGIAAMVRAGLWPRSAVGIAAAGVALGSVLPPSLLLALYSMDSHAGAFVLAAIAGAGLLVLCSGAVLLSPLRFRDTRPAADPGADHTAARLFRVGIVPAVVLIPLLSGRFTLAESAAAGAFTALAVGLGTRRLQLSSLKPILVEAGRVSAPILFLLIAGGVFAWLVTASGIPRMVAELFKHIPYALAGGGMLVVGAAALRWLGLGPVTLLMVLFPLWLPLMTISVGRIGADLFGVILLLIVQAVALFIPSDDFVTAVRAALGEENLRRRQVVAACRPYAIIFIVVGIALIALSNSLWGLL